MTDEIGSTNLSLSSGHLRTARTKFTISKTKQKLQQNKIPTKKLALELGISRTSAQRILRCDLICRPCEHLVVPTPAEEHEGKCLPPEYEKNF